MRNTIGVVALMNGSRETNYFRDFCAVFQVKSSSSLLSPGYVLSMFVDFGGFQLQVLLKKVFAKKSVFSVNIKPHGIQSEEVAQRSREKSDQSRSAKYGDNLERTFRSSDGSEFCI